MSHHSPVRLLDKVRQRIRLKGYSIRTERSYSQWIKRFILFRNKRHPRDMGKMEIEAFLSDLAMNRNVAASTQNQDLVPIGTSYIYAFERYNIVHRTLEQLEPTQILLDTKHPVYLRSNCDG